jgi:hypothetical protein
MIDYNFMGPASDDASKAARAVASAMEMYSTTEFTRYVVECALIRLGDGWDEKSLRAVLENCSFFDEVE